MILTVTLNPSVDISYKLKHFSIDDVNRITDVSKTAGGKGLNVSRVLKQLDEEVGATGFLGGSLGGFIKGELEKDGIKNYFVDCKGDTRNCIGIIHDQGKQTEILEAGPIINDSESIEFLKNFKNTLEEIKLVTISGSLPQGIDKNFYNDLITIANDKDIPVFLDTGGSLLKETLKHKDKPILIKPNETELADLFNKDMLKEKEIVESLRSSLFKEIEWVVVTLGSKGSIIKHIDKIYKVDIPKVEAINPVGSGDSVIAGFAAGMIRGYQPEKLIKFGLSMGILNAMEEKTGYINPEKIEWCIDKINIKE